MVFYDIFGYIICIYLGIIIYAFGAGLIHHWGTFWRILTASFWFSIGFKTQLFNLVIFIAELIRFSWGLFLNVLFMIYYVAWNIPWRNMMRWIGKSRS